MLGNHLNIVTELSKFDKFQESISETSDGSSFSLVINYPCSSTTFCDPIEAYAKPGVYLFEVWGAQGGNTSIASNNGGRGGYSYGLITFCKHTTIYIYIGAKGYVHMKHNEETERSFNGGGSGFYYNDDSERYSGSGGGATDVRVNGQHLENRIIVAGGGGGSGLGPGKIYN